MGHDTLVNALHDVKRDMEDGVKRSQEHIWHCLPDCDRPAHMKEVGEESAKRAITCLIEEYDAACCERDCCDEDAAKELADAIVEASELRAYGVGLHLVCLLLEHLERGGE